MREEVATKTDLAAVRTGLSTDIAAVRTDLAAVKAELKGDIAAVRVEIQAVKHDVLRWMVGVAFAQAVLTMALIRFMPH